MLVLITGLPGSGKTTFAQALAKACGAGHLNSDVVRSALGKRGQYGTAAKTMIYEALLRQTAAALQSGQSVVVDATFFKSGLRQPFIQVAADAGQAVYWIAVKADEGAIRQRLAKSRPYTEADFEVYKKMKTAYEPLEAAHLVLWSDQFTVDEMVGQAMKYLNDGKKNPS
ncbi:MAG: ATP-binding protein [Bacteroidetes bacterium]|nr:ATP-binding protein [Bacteroidota bacterium]